MHFDKTNNFCQDDNSNFLSLKWKWLKSRQRHILHLIEIQALEKPCNTLNLTYIHVQNSMFPIDVVSSIGTSSVARGLSVYLDALTNNTMSHFFLEIIPMNVDFLARYPDFFSFVVVLLLTVLLSIGVKESSILNNVFTIVNLATIITVIVSGAIKGRSKTCFSLFLN